MKFIVLTFLLDMTPYPDTGPVVLFRSVLGSPTVKPLQTTAVERVGVNCLFVLYKRGPSQRHQNRRPSVAGRTLYGTTQGRVRTVVESDVDPKRGGRQRIRCRRNREGSPVVVGGRGCVGPTQNRPVDKRR